MTSRAIVRSARSLARWNNALASPVASRLPATVRVQDVLMPSNEMKHAHFNIYGARTFSGKDTFEEKPSEETPPADNETTENEEAAAPEEPQVSKEEQLEAQLKELKDSMMRALAEQENTRRIAKKDIQDARNYAVKSFAKSLLDVSDNLSRALQAVPEELRADKDNHPVLATLYEGIEMTQSGLDKAFTSNGLKKYGEVGDEFDPHKYSALYEYPDSEKKPGTVGQIIKVGFTLNDRVLRPAEVGVVKKE